MTNNPKKPVTVKIFLGCQLTPELGLQLQQSKEWRQDHVVPKADGEGLIKTLHQSKRYVGMFLANEMPSLPELKEYELKVQKILNTYCPFLRVDHIPITLFPQIFIS